MFDFLRGNNWNFRENNGQPKIYVHVYVYVYEHLYSSPKVTSVQFFLIATEYYVTKFLEICSKKKK